MFVIFEVIYSFISFFILFYFSIIEEILYFMPPIRIRSIFCFDYSPNWFPFTDANFKFLTAAAFYDGSSSAYLGVSFTSIVGFLRASSSAYLLSSGSSIAATLDLNSFGFSGRPIVVDVYYFESIFGGFPYFFSASARMDIMSLVFPYNPHLTVTLGTGFSMENLLQPAKN
jgi:hypothetical protein